jgi:hypothetical protein
MSMVPPPSFLRSRSMNRIKLILFTSVVKACCSRKLTPSRALASTGANLDQLAKLQAEQDKSV